MAGSGNGTNRSELDAYTQMVTHLTDANRERIREFDERYYSGVPLRARPAEFDSSRPGSEFTPQWSLLNPSSPARWFEADNNQPILFYVNPAGAPSFAMLQDDMQAAMNAWSTSGASIRATCGGTTSGCGVQLADGLNTISFNNCDGYFAASQGCAGLLAVSGIVRYIPSQSKNVGGVTYGQAIEANVSFNPYALCNIANRCQLQEVATHEMGHALGLGHTTDSSATMAAYVHFDNRCALLMPDDVRGITAIYPGGSGEGGLNVMTSNLPTADVNQDYSTNLAASGGAGGYRWDLVSGNVPSGIQFSTSGLLYGKTTAPGNFDFTARVRDSLGNASQKSFTLVVKGPDPFPAITGAQYKKKKIFLSGTNFQANAAVYVDGESLSATLDGETLTTEKRKQKPGAHEVYVVNPDGKRSSSFLLVIE